MNSEISLEAAKKMWHGNLKSYVIGFIASIILTSLSFSVVLLDYFTAKTNIYLLVSLALTQAIFQLVFFLHLWSGPKPRWHLWIFLFMLFILVIIVVGSLWIMYDLNARMMGNIPGMEGMYD